MSRKDITSDVIGDIPTIPIYVGFSNQPFPDDVARLISIKLFASLNSYYQKISYGKLKLVKDTELKVSVAKAPSEYSWGYTDFEVQGAKDLTKDVFAQVLALYPNTTFQDRIALLILNTSSFAIQGRAAMCLVPGVLLHPSEDSPQNQELFIGPIPRDGPVFLLNKGAFFIEEGYTFPTYYSKRGTLFENGTDQFIRGMSIFCRDVALSCAVHDVIHGIKRLAPGLPTTSLPGSRARAVSCLYNNFIQKCWVDGETGIDRSAYCTPYVGWWDNTGDHLHPKQPRPFFSGDPYGVSSFTKMRLDFIPSSHIQDVTEGENSFQLAPLAVTTLPPQTGGQPKLVAKVPLTGDGKEYLLLEYRHYVTVDDVTVNYAEIMGDSSDDPECVNPPEHLVSDSGVLIYHVNEEKSHLGRDPGQCIDITSMPLLIRDFILYLYTPSMIVGDGTLNWSGRTKTTLKTAAFKPSSNPGFYVKYPLDPPYQFYVRVRVTSADGTRAAVTVTKGPL